MLCLTNLLGNIRTCIVHCILNKLMNDLYELVTHMQTVNTLSLHGLVTGLWSRLPRIIHVCVWQIRVLGLYINKYTDSNVFWSMTVNKNHNRSCVSSQAFPSSTDHESEVTSTSHESRCCLDAACTCCLSCTT